MKSKKLFKEIKASAIKDNPFKVIGSDWMLITAGSLRKYNMMTASWGALGVLWHKNVCFCFVRPTRHTHEFMEKNNYFTLSFFGKKHKRILDFCGAKSGRDVDKAKETGLLPFEAGPKAVSFQQARLVIVCKKIYFQQIDPAHFLDGRIEDLYPEKDYHRMYVGEIVKCLKKD